MADIHKLTHMERIIRTLKGEPTDRPPYGAWGHVMNLSDRHAGDFARSTIGFQLMNDFDFVKVMSNSCYMVEDCGMKIHPARDYTEWAFFSVDDKAVHKPSDWDTLVYPDVKKGSLAREIEAIRRICGRFGGEVPVIASIFTPIDWINHLAFLFEELKPGIERCGSFIPDIEKYILKNEKRVLIALENFLEINEAFMEELLKAGVSGFFYATQFARDYWSDPDYFETFGKKYDIPALEAVKDKTIMNVLHVCGMDRVRLDWVKDYPVDVFNWDDVLPGNPSMKEARCMTDKTFMGGLNRMLDLEGSDREKIKQTIVARLHKAMEDAGNKLIFSGGCDWKYNAVHRFPVWHEVMEEFAFHSQKA